MRRPIHDNQLLLLGLIFSVTPYVAVVRVDLVPMELHTFETGQPAGCNA